MQKERANVEQAGFRAFEVQGVRGRDYFNFHQQLWTRGILAFATSVQRRGDLPLFGDEAPNHQRRGAVTLGKFLSS